MQDALHFAVQRAVQSRLIDAKLGPQHGNIGHAAFARANSLMPFTELWLSTVRAKAPPGGMENSADQLSAHWHSR